MRCFLPTLFSALFIITSAARPSYSEILSRPCPYSCRTARIPDSRCRDWRVGNRCFVERITTTTQTLILCANNTTGTVSAKTSCKNDGSEEHLNLTSLKGEKGSQGDKGVQGEKGDTGNQGPQGEDGILRIYGDGSGGAKTFTANTTFQEDNPQFTNVSINAGVTLTVPSGTVIRCSGTFTNNGTIVTSPGLRQSPKFGENGLIVDSGSSAGSESSGGTGGGALPLGAAKQTLRLGILSAGNGHQEKNDTGEKGGGNFTVICKGAVTNNGIIRARGMNASTNYRGGGGGGFLILASAESVANNGTIEADGGNGGALLAVDSNNTGFGPGGGGGGGIVHLIAPTIVSSGTISVNGGNGGAAGGAGSITGILYFGGGGGGGAGGAGGDGGAVNPANIGNGSTTAAEDGDSGQLLQTVADPSAYF